MTLIKDQLLKALRYVARHNPDVRVETAWLTINQMAELFHVDKSGISRHLKNMYESGELVQAATVAKFATVQTERSPSINRKLEH